MIIRTLLRWILCACACVGSIIRKCIRCRSWQRVDACTKKMGCILDKSILLKGSRLYLANLSRCPVGNVLGCMLSPKPGRVDTREVLATWQHMTRQDKTRQLKSSCLIISYCDVSLAPISLATLYVLRTLLASLVTGTFLRLKEMIGNGKKNFILSTSSRISTTSAGVLSLAIVICASWLSPPIVDMARLGNDVHPPHMLITLKFQIIYVACDI